MLPKYIGFANALLRQGCLPDSEYPTGLVNSLYFDTSDLDQYERAISGDIQKDKIRIRWYDVETDFRGQQPVFIELKSKRAFAGTKQRLRLTVPVENLALINLTKGIVPLNTLMGTLASFGYFTSAFLQPIIIISFQRHRFTDIKSGQRVSLDYHLRSTMVIPGKGYGEKELELTGAVIEIKGQTDEISPALSQIRMLKTDWTSFSKYSACIKAHTEEHGGIGRLSPSGKIVG